MKNKFVFCMMSFAFFAIYHDVKAMEEKPKKLKGSKEITEEKIIDLSSSGSPTNSEKTKRRRDYYNEIKIQNPHMSLTTSHLPPISSQLVSPRLKSSGDKSPTRSPRPVHNNLVLLGNDRLPVETVDLGESDEKNASTLEDALKKYNVDVFVLFGEENKLDKNCDLQLAAHLKKCKVVRFDTVQAFYEAMEMWFQKNDDDLDMIKVIAVYGASNDKNFYGMLAEWAIPIMIKHAIKRNDLINVDGKDQSITDIIVLKQKMKTIADYILRLVYQRVLPKADKPHHYLYTEQITALYDKCILQFLQWLKD